MNLLSNALKFTKTKGVIKIGVELIPSAADQEQQTLRINQRKANIRANSFSSFDS